MKIPQFIKSIYFRYFLRVKKGKCLFVPHSGFCKLDKASIINYKADNCLVFARYILDNGLYDGKEIVVVSTSIEAVQKEQDFCNQHYPKASIRIIPNISRLVKSAWASSEYIFESEPHFSYKKKKEQTYICLTYYPLSLKNDFFEYQHVYYNNKEQIDIVSSASLVNSYMDSASLSIPFDRLKMVGKCRSDAIQQQEDVSFVLSFLHNQSRNYDFSKVLLYVPTHRDYERASFDIKRSILGFDVNKEYFEKFLIKNKLLIVCKLHPHQNAEIIDSDLPKGVLIFKAQEDFGLVELMKASDGLITDYTSAYIDYLLLDKPVVFNFYDLAIYEKTRGLSIYPYSRICAGEIFHDEPSFYSAITETLAYPDRYKKKREEVIDELNTCNKNVCQQTYKLVFKK